MSADETWVPPTDEENARRAAEQAEARAKVRAAVDAYDSTDAGSFVPMHEIDEVVEDADNHLLVATGILSTGYASGSGGVSMSAKDYKAAMWALSEARLALWSIQQRLQEAGVLMVTGVDTEVAAEARQ